MIHAHAWRSSAPICGAGNTAKMDTAETSRRVIPSGRTRHANKTDAAARGPRRHLADDENGASALLLIALLTSLAGLLLLLAGSLLSAALLLLTRSLLAAALLLARILLPGLLLLLGLLFAALILLGIIHFNTSLVKRSTLCT